MISIAGLDWDELGKAKCYHHCPVLILSILLSDWHAAQEHGGVKLTWCACHQNNAKPSEPQSYLFSYRRRYVGWDYAEYFQKHFRGRTVVN